MSDWATEPMRSRAWVNHAYIYNFRSSNEPAQAAEWEAEWKSERNIPNNLTKKSYSSSDFIRIHSHPVRHYSNSNRDVRCGDSRRDRGRHRVHFQCGFHI